MRKRQWLFTVCIAAVLLPGLGAAPRYLESLRVGGGYGDRDGGLDIDPDGTLSTNGAILAEGGVTLRGPLRAGTEEHALTTDEGLLDAGALDIPAAQDESLPDDGDTLLIHDASAGATREMSRADFLSGTGEQLWNDTGDAIQPVNAPSLRIQDTGDVTLPKALQVQGPLSAGTASGTSYLVKAQFEGSAALSSSSRSALEGQIVWSGGFHSGSSIYGVAGHATVGSGYSASGTDVIGTAGRVTPGALFTTINRGIGVRGEVLLNQMGGLTNGIALHGRVTGTTGTVTNLYGLYIEDITRGSTANYAIYTGLGACRFGDDVTIAGDLEVQGGALAAPGSLSVSAGSGVGTLTLASSNLSVTASQLQQQGQVRVHDSTLPGCSLDRTGTPVSGTTIGTVTFRGLNSASAPVSYAVIAGKMQHIADDSEAGQLEFRLLDGGAQATALRLDGSDAVFAADASVGGALSTPALVTFAADDTTPSVRGANIFRVPDTWTAGHNVTQLDDGVAGQFATIIGGDADCVFTDNISLQLAGPWTAHPADTLVLVYVGGAWYEISRSDN